MMVGSFGKLFIAAVIGSGDIKTLLKAGNIDDLFKASEVDLWQFVKGHAKAYHTLPAEETIKAHTGEELPEPKEPPDYYLDLMRDRHTELSLKKAMKDASEYLSPQNKQPMEALQSVTSAVMQLVTQHHGHSLSDFREAKSELLQAYKDAASGGTEGGVEFGWPTLDGQSGGVHAGDVVSFVGRPALGKTWKLLYGAHHAWRTQGKVPLFVSMEMPKLQIEQRLAAMYSHLPMSHLKNADMTTKQLKAYKAALIEIEGMPSPFWVVDGNFTATVEDVYMLAEQLQPDAIYIDGAYLLKHPTERDRYKRVAENAELIKQELSKQCGVLASWQFSREASKKAKKKNENVGLEDIGYTDAIGQSSSIVLGLFEEDSVETLKQRRVEILKGRHGETGQFVTRWDFQKMDFTEVVEESLEDLQFV